MNLVELIGENFKGVVAVRIKPKGPVTEIVGKNGAGKTSVLDLIECVLGGTSSSPEMPIRRGQTKARGVADLGDIVVERRWTSKGGSTLEIRNKDGTPIKKSPQALLDILYLAG